MKTTHLRAKFLPLLVGAALAGGATSHAAVYFTLQQQGTNLLLSLQAGGSLVTTGLGTPTLGGNEPGGLLQNVDFAPFSQIVLTVGTASSSDLYSSSVNFPLPVTGPSTIGPGSPFVLTSSTTSGPFFGFAFGSVGSQLTLPFDYRSGSPLGAASATFAPSAQVPDISLAAMGINVGNYTWTLGNGDTINLTVVGGSGGSSVPETGSLLVPALAMSALGLIQWRRRARRT
jgi:hypothetical protein